MVLTSQFWIVPLVFAAICGPAPTLANRLSVFVISLGRSGSTILTNILNSIPGFCIRGENNGILDGIEAAYTAAESGQRLGTVNATWHAAWIGAEKIDVNAFRDSLVGNFERNVLRCPPDAVAVGFKEIRYERSVQRTSELISFLASGAFPSPRLVFNVRNITAILASRRTANWSPYAGIRDRIDRIQNLFRLFCEKNPQTGYLVDYDSYKSNVAQLSGLFTFLGVPFDLERTASVVAKPIGH